MICWDRLNKTMNNFIQVREVAETETGHILDTSHKLPKPTGSVLKITTYNNAPHRCIHWVNMMLITTTISHWNFNIFYTSFIELPQCKYPLYVLPLTQFVTFWETNYTIPHNYIITSLSLLHWSGNLYLAPINFVLCARVIYIPLISLPSSLPCSALHNICIGHNIPQLIYFVMLSTGTFHNEKLATNWQV